jgi:8-oxo-dGTP pyrophosphatase MutT (NUDIX family)
MIQPPGSPEIFTKRDLFLERVKEKIWTNPCNFGEAYSRLKSPADQKGYRLAAGVLMPLLFCKPPRSNLSPEGSFAIMLVKRSSQVAQPGDLGFPGGMLNNIWDRILRFPFTYGPLSLVNGEARHFLDKQKKTTAKLITLFMTTAFRESWEEIRLSPFQTRFLGPLPTRNLTLFKRTIFPIVGFVENHGQLHPNQEAEKIVEIPLSSFYQQDFLGCLQIAASGQRGQTMQYPCLIHQDTDGQEEILWGATFYITLEFLKIVMDYHLPEWKSNRVILKSLTSDYLARRSES